MNSAIDIAKWLARAVLLPRHGRKVISRDGADTSADPLYKETYVELVTRVRGLPLKEKFTQVYRRNIFGGTESRSGLGSDLVQTAIIRREIPILFPKYGIHSLLDAPCGDCYWMREMSLPGAYVGADIVEQMIERNRVQFGRPGVRFACLDLSVDRLPRADMILCRDCLVHLSFADVKKVLMNFKRSGSTYLLTTTFTARSTNNDLDLADGFWRPLNLQLPPFALPPPLEIINEGCTEWGSEFADKSLGLWSLENLDLEIH